MSLARRKAHAALAQSRAWRRWRRSSQRRAPRRPRSPQTLRCPKRVSSRRARLTVTGGVRWNIQEATWNADLAVIQEENQVFVVPRSAPEGPFFENGSRTWRQRPALATSYQSLNHARFQIFTRGILGQQRGHSLYPAPQSFAAGE